MSFLYYNSIFKREGKANAVFNAAHPNFNIFKEYLDIAIRTQKDKKVCVNWELAEEAVIKNIKCLVKSFKYELNATLQFKVPQYVYLLQSQEIDTIEIDEINKVFIRTSTDFIDLELSKDKFFKVENEGFYVFFDSKLGEEISMTVLNNKHMVTLHKIDIDGFSLSEIKQEGNNGFLPIEIKKEHGLANIAFKGDLDISKPLLVGKIPIADYYLLEKDTYSDITYKDGNKINIINQNLNTIFTKDNVDEFTEMYMNGIRISHKMVEIKIPDKILYKDKWYNINNDGRELRISYNSSLELGKPIIVKDENGIDFEINISRNSTSSDSLLIRLLDEDENDDDMVATFSKLDYFFEEGVNYVDNGMPRRSKEFKEFKIKRKYREENLLELQSGERFKRITFDSLPPKLFLPINTYQLEKQRQSIQNIKFTPLVEHKGLLSLAEKKEDNNAWPNFYYDTVEKWHILTDESRDGTLTQREFVKGALSTPDFMLLEGPPGSGKTTAIVELIIQLIKRNKRVLLSASTHVAIDNVIERLSDEKGKMFEGILPIRIGDSNNLSRDVKEFGIDNVIDSDTKRFEKIILESANLVCGTTIGILQHPLFKKDNEEPITADFDYLIIDESSKTTFQEFLVPALYAKKWVLVGDIKQLSPFTDRDHIVANLSDFVIDKGNTREVIFRDFEQQASLLLFRFLEKENLSLSSRNYMSIKVSQDVLKSAILELRSRVKNNPSKYKEKSKYVGFIVDSKLGIDLDDEDTFHIITKDEIVSGDPKGWLLAGLSLLFIDATIHGEIKDYIPENKLPLGLKDWEESKEYFKATQFYHNSANKIEVNDKRKDILSIKDIIRTTNDFLQNKTWASEVAWRVIRKYELRLSDNQLLSYDKDVEALVPYINREDILSKIDVVHSIALPSTLECLQKGVPTKREFRYNTVLNSGFNDEDKKKRHVVLDYQHRMHKEISQFPRRQFYNDLALRDSHKVLEEREWDYDRYQARNTWIDVNGVTNRNFNIKEAKVLMNELKNFVKWAKNSNKKWTVACLTFYKGQERKLREELQQYCNQSRRTQNFEKDNVQISLYTIDKFQGREADITFISMVQTFRVGFLDSPNRLNVALTRARFQRVIIGKRAFFANQRSSEELKRLAISEVVLKEEDIR